MMPAPRDRRKAVRHQHRRGARGIEQQKPFAPFPGTFFHQPQVEAMFAQHQANEARMRTERVVKERVHEILELKIAARGTLRAGSCESGHSQAGASGNQCLAFFCNCDREANRREERAFYSQNGPHYDVGCSESGDSRHHRGYHGIPAGFVHRSHAAGATLLRPRRRRLLAEFRDPDPARRDPCDRDAVFLQAVGAWRSACSRNPRRSALRHRRAGGVPAGGGRRPRRRQIHQGIAVQSVGGVLHADRRRRDPAMGRSARSRAASSTTPRAIRC